MLPPLILLERLPSATDFYDLYWNRRPFVVRGAILRDDFQTLITAEELAGLSMEEEPQSRLVKTAGEYQDWSCRYGPFSEEDFTEAGDTDWSLLVQNVEQFHPETAALLRYFNFTPRWLMDDIMVGYSAPRGSVGPHLDSYHVFIVQGQGRRRWKVGRTPIQDETYIEGIDLKILKGAFAGDEIEMTCGDVLYVPPKFAHEGTTMESALTFSVGFLGPKISELLSAYGHYISEREYLDQRYVGDRLAEDSAGFTMGNGAVGAVQDLLFRELKGPDFARWLAAFFTESSHEDFGDYQAREDRLSGAAFAAKVRQGESLIKPEYVKFALTTSRSGTLCLGFDGKSFILDEGRAALLKIFMKEQAVNVAKTPELLEPPAHLDLLCDLYNHSALEFVD